MKLEIDKVYNCDCIELMQAMIEQGIKADWCITDPPYGIGYTDMTGGGDSACERREYDYKEWDKVRIGKEKFDLIMQVSNQQIIFGGNYYTDYLPPTPSWVIWNKRRDGIRNDFADCELAWCSSGVARIFNYEYMGMLQGDMKNKDYRFHPTQKPTQLWTKILNFYTKVGDLILDPFAGSQSLRIACHKMQRHYIGAERDKDYYHKGCAWYNTVANQISFFDLTETN